MKRKLAFILACFSNPKNKFLDEPTSGVDPMTRKLFQKVIRDQKMESKASTIFTTHTMEEAEMICDRLVILINGMVSAVGTAEELKQYSEGLTLTVDKEKKTEDISETVRKVSVAVPELKNPDVRIDAVGNLAVAMRFKLGEGVSLADRVDSLEMIKADGMIKDYKIAHQGLEDMFYKLSQLQRSLEL